MIIIALYGVFSESEIKIVKIKSEIAEFKS